MEARHHPLYSVYHLRHGIDTEPLTRRQHAYAGSVLPEEFHPNGAAHWIPSMRCRRGRLPFRCVGKSLG